MKPVKHSVAVVVRSPSGGAFLIVRRPPDDDDPLAGVWGLPAVTLLDGEDERTAVVRAGRVKLGVALAAGAWIGEKTADRGGYLLRLADYEATILNGDPVVPQPDSSMTQYAACRYTADPGTLAEAAARGSLCAQVFLEDRACTAQNDNSNTRLAAAEESAATGQPTAAGAPASTREPAERARRAGQEGAAAEGQPAAERAGRPGA